jgi:uncharacterized protein with beta-barrel porin domain
VRRHIVGSCVALLLCGIGWTRAGHTQNATWNGTTGNFDAAANWSPAAVPTGTAYFGSTGVADITYSAKITLGSFTFNPGAQAFTFTSTTVSTGIVFDGAGIVDNSSTAPRFSNTNGGAVPQASGLTFTNQSSAGDARIANTDGGITLFAGSSTAGTAVITSSRGTALFSAALFTGTSNAGNAHITNNIGGTAQFNAGTSAGNAALVNNGGSIASFNIATFVNALLNPATVAPSANDVGITSFVGSSAGAASITNNSGGVTAFLLGSTAAGATIVTNAGGATFLTGASSGGAASLIINTGGTLDLTAHDPGSLTAGSLVQAAGSLYRVAAAPGQNTALALSGTANLQGAILQVAPAAANYWRNPTYALVSAAGGVSGTFATVNSFAFLAPTLGYDAHNVYLGLSQSFARGGQTANQQAVGAALDHSAPTASGDFNTVIGTLAVAGSGQGPQVLNTLGGQPYADFATLNVQTGYAFLNAVGAQMAAVRDGVPAARAALAEACQTACPGAPTGSIGAWMSALGGTGSVLGDANAGTLTYSLGGVAAGADYRLDPRLLVGASVGYAAGSQWVNGFDTRGTSDALSVSLYASFVASAFYLDGLAGYTNATNRLTRNIVLPGLATRTANGQASATQFLGQVEAGYRMALETLAPALSVTPFVRLQGSTTNQPGFTESGASSLNLFVASQTTNSLRSTLGADLKATVGPIDFDVRLGWLHEYADTSRPLTASFAGAPGFSYTVFGATPPRDSAVLGLAANASIASTTRVYLRYEGAVGGGTDNHALTLGLRLSW